MKASVNTKYGPPEILQIKEVEKLSRTQKIIGWFASKSLFEKMEQDSKLWVFDCECGKTSSIWDIGGVRYKGKGNPYSLVKCPHCKKRAMRTIHKKV